MARASIIFGSPLLTAAPNTLNAGGRLVPAAAVDASVPSLASQAVDGPPLARRMSSCSSASATQGLTLVHVRAQLEQLQDTFMS